MRFESAMTMMMAMMLNYQVSVSAKNKLRIFLAFRTEHTIDDRILAIFQTFFSFLLSGHAKKNKIKKKIL